MPEVAEVAHVVALLRRNILGTKIKSVVLNNDPLLFPFIKAATEPEKVLETMRKNLVGSTIDSVGRHGKYFWVRIQPSGSVQTSVLLMHLGMTGMIKLRNVESHLILMENGGDKKVKEKIRVESSKSKYFDEEIKKENGISSIEEPWPPKFSKMEWTLEKGQIEIDLSFVDMRRLGRVRYLSGDKVQTNEDLLLHEPLSALGPDWSKPDSRVSSKVKFEFGDPDPDHHGRSRLGIEEFNKLVLSKKKPIKSLLLDQAYFAGVGNWVADEVIYQARIHPGEVLSQTIEIGDEIDPRITRLYESLIEVCKQAVQVEGDSTKFPAHWLMLHRWGKARKKEKAKTSEGYEVDHVTVGGRTSCFVPALQVISGTIAPAAKKQKLND